MISIHQRDLHELGLAIESSHLDEKNRGDHVRIESVYI